MRQLFLALALFVYNHIITHIPIYFIRHGYLSGILLMKLGRGISIQPGCTFSGRMVSIGDRTVINRNCRFDGRVGIEIGSDVSISPECYILSLTHDAQDPDFKAIPKPVRIGNHAWLGVRALVLPGANLGEGSVVGAGAIVTKPVADFIIVAGNPAKQIGIRNRDLRYRLKYFPILDSDITLDA